MTATDYDPYRIIETPGYREWRQEAGYDRTPRTSTVTPDPFQSYGLRAVEDTLNNVGRRCSLPCDMADGRWTVLAQVERIQGTSYYCPLYVVAHLHTGEWRLEPLPRLGNLA